jgi:pantothenate kinase-related protein Tda10
MTVFLAVSQGGGVISVVKARDFNKAYKETIGLNNGEMLVEVTRQDFKEISKLFGNKEQKVIAKIWEHVRNDENDAAVGDFHRQANEHIKKILLKYA